MKKEINSIRYQVLSIAFIIFYFLFFTCASQPWLVPQGWSVKRNPTPLGSVSVQAGKNIYRANCIICHGEGGKGNGTLALSLNPRPADHTSKKFQQQKDGELFYKIITGRNAMPSFKQVLSENEIWSVINFIRTLEVKAKPVSPKSTATATATVAASVQSNQQKNIFKDTSSEKQAASVVKRLDTLSIHQENISQTVILQKRIADTSSFVSAIASDTIAIDSLTLNNPNEDSKEERRKFLLSGSANLDINIDGRKFNSAGIAVGFMPVILWKPSKNLFFESHFHIMAGSGTSQSNTSSSSGSMSGMLMRIGTPPPTVQHSGMNSTPAVTSSTSTSSTISMASIMLAYADLVYFINPYVTLTGGIFLSPFGLYPERLHAPWLNRLPDAPAGMGNEQVLPETELGVQFRGGIPIGKTKLVYATYISNGPFLVDDTSGNAGKLSFNNLVDNNKNKALGGRIGFFPLPNNRSLEIGFFGQRARVGQDATPHAGVQALLYGSDISFHHYFRFIKGTIDMKGQHCKVSLDKVYYKANPMEVINVPAEDVNLKDSTYRFNNVTELYFIMMSYRPTASEHFLKNVEYNFRYDYLKEPAFARWNISASRLTMGITYWLESRSAMKLAYQISMPQNIFSKNQNMLMLQWVIGL
ncbi:MAG: cytochrome c [Bacteroidetes bacterium]|nr:cytochrome c [Bacteroidota bacterium]